MKRILGLFLILIITMGVTASALQAGYLPAHDGANVTVTANPKRVNLVINNADVSCEDIIYGFLAASAIAEDSDFYLYLLNGTKGPIKIEHTAECINKIMTEYTVVDNQPREVYAYQTALDDLFADTAHTQKELIMFFGNGNYSQKFEEFANIKSWYPDIPAVVYTNYSNNSVWRENGIGAFNYLRSDSIYDQYLKKYGYSEIPSSYYDYDYEKGTVTIDQGRADANIVIYAYSRKADLLYISGYMAPAAVYESNKAKKTIKGVSLGYNMINLEKTNSPKNVAWALYSIDESLYDVNETGFIIPVKNAESVALYYKSDMGKGVCNASAKYQREQDDGIKNLNAPEEVVAADKNDSNIEDYINTLINNKKPSSVNKNTSSEGSGKVWKIVKSVLGFILKAILFILALAWSLFRIALFVLIILMLVNKKVRANITSRVMNSKAGPIIEKIVFKLRTLWANITQTDPPIQGVEKEDKNFVFISHSSKDRMIPNNRIETVVKELERRNIKCWISNKNIKAGQNYSGVLAKAIENCSIFMVFLSDASAQSKEVGREMTLATSNSKEIIPVQIENVDIMGKYSEWKYWLSTSQIKFLFNNEKKRIDELADEVESIYQRYVPDYNVNVVKTVGASGSTSQSKVAAAEKKSIEPEKEKKEVKSEEKPQEKAAVKTVDEPKE